MKILLKVNLILFTILSIATGIFKILQQPADIELFAALGFSAIATTMLGVIQFLGGLMLIFPKYRVIGAWVLLPTFAIASIAVFANKMMAFGTVSILFIAMNFAVILTQKIALK